MKDIADLLRAVADLLWPILLVVLAIIFRREFIGILRRIRRGKLLGQEIELADVQAKAALADVPALLTGIEKTRLGESSAGAKTSTDEKRPVVAAATKREIVANLSEDFCLYLLRVANRPFSASDHFDLIRRDLLPGIVTDPADELGEFGRELREVASSANAGDRLLDLAHALTKASLRGLSIGMSAGHWVALFQFNRLIFSFEGAGEGKITIRVDPEVLELVRRRVGSERANPEA